MRRHVNVPILLPFRERLPTINTRMFRIVAETIHNIHAASVRSPPSLNAFPNREFRGRLSMSVCSHLSLSVATADRCPTTFFKKLSILKRIRSPVRTFRRTKEITSKVRGRLNTLFIITVIQLHQVDFRLDLYTRFLSTLRKV